MMRTCSKFRNLSVIIAVSFCPKTPILLKGSKYCSNGNNIGSYCNMTCAPGYQLIGSSSRTCLKTGVWSGKMTSCVKGLLAFCSLNFFFFHILNSSFCHYFYHRFITWKMSIPFSGFQYKEKKKRVETGIRKNRACKLVKPLFCRCSNLSVNQQTILD